MKNYRILIVTIFICCCLISLMGCSSTSINAENNYGEFYTLQEAYNLGYLTLDDVKSIAYYQNNGLEWFSEGEGEYMTYKSKPSKFYPIAKNPKELDTDLQSLIKKDWVDYLRIKSNIRGIKAKDILITNYYGTYNGYTAIMLDGYGFFTQAIRYVTIEDVVIRYNDGNSIRIWKQNIK